jgi:hypothetical protein
MRCPRGNGRGQRVISLEADVEGGAQSDAAVDVYSTII